MANNNTQTHVLLNKWQRKVNASECEVILH